MWIFPRPELPTLFDQYEYQARRCKGAGWHPSLLLSESQVAALRDALEYDEGKEWLESKGERRVAPTLALLRSFMKYSLEDPHPAIVRYFCRLPKESARVRFERQAHEWYLAGRPEEMLVDSYRLVALRCWVGSDGGKKQPISTFLRNFLEESDASLPLSYAMTLGDRQFCHACHETYRVENLMLCTHCSDLWCHGCIYRRKTPKHPNGNHICPCDEGELVG